MEKKILELFSRGKSKWNLKTMARELGLRSFEVKTLRRHLKKLQKEGKVERHKGVYKLSPSPYLLRGEFLATAAGFAFVRPEMGGPDIFIPARASFGAQHGDLVEITLHEGRDGRLEGRVVRVVQPKPTLLGFYAERYGQPFFLPLDDPIHGEIALDPRERKGLAQGTVVEIDRQSNRIISVFGLPDEPGVDTQVIIRRHALETVYSADALAEAAAMSSRLNQEARKGRKDYRRWPIITIDGEKAQDFDDAVSLHRLNNGNYLLGVHIADVSHYVRPGSPLDLDARRRGTSVYFPDLTLHMLPEVLATELCSLRPRVTRLTFSVLLEINRRGEVERAEFHPSLIKTVERMTYTSVYKIFQGDEEERKRYASLVDTLLQMRELAALLREKREAAGSLNFDLLEPELIYEEGKLAEVAALEQNEAHHLIEEFMVAANEAVASYLSEHNYPAIYRVHPPPAARDLEELRQKALALGLFLPRGDQIRPSDLQGLLRAAKGRPEEKYINVQLLRSLKLAVYSEENIGHYGLAKAHYTHFTSPIRRYPDLFVHRLLKAALRGEKPPAEDLAALAGHCSVRERRADEAERDLIEWRIFRWLKTKLGEEMRGLVVGVNRAGVVVELEDYFVQGMLAFSDLKGDHDWRRSEDGLVGKRTGRKVRLGDRITVILASVDPSLRRINLVLPAGYWGKKR